MPKNINKTKCISCIVPAYNEACGIAEFITELIKTLQNMSYSYELLIVDDGSEDDTPLIIQQLRSQFVFRYLRLSRNFGKENAISAGLDHAQGDAVILIDSDFQHPLDILNQFITQWEEGYDMVYAVRQNRPDESFLKRSCAKAFYRLSARINQVTIPENAGDFRLLDRKIVTTLKKLPERNRFMKGLYSWVGFKQAAIPYEAQPRKAGTSQWSYYALFDLAITGITSFTVFPLRMIALGGMSIATLATVYGFWILFRTLIWGTATPGWNIVITAISFFGGLQLCALGIVGEYIGRVFDEVKHRPHYVVDEEVSFNDYTI